MYDMIVVTARVAYALHNICLFNVIIQDPISSFWLEPCLIVNAALIKILIPS